MKTLQNKRSAMYNRISNKKETQEKVNKLFKVH